MFHILNAACFVLNVCKENRAVRAIPQTHQQFDRLLLFPRLAEVTVQGALLLILTVTENGRFTHSCGFRAALQAGRLVG